MISTIDLRMTFIKILSKKNRLKLGFIVILTILLSILEFLVFSFIEPIINSFSENTDTQKINLERSIWQIINLIIPITLVIISGIFKQYARKKKYSNEK